ncbi:MAG: DUF6485 family protein [Candidatus Omnitrophica bacterium]|nr:DUF6485 family protein [Candidatus Omnitrophota bacterium]
MKDCPNRKVNIQGCNCTYEPCGRKGVCCECLRYHRSSGGLPACFFTPEIEKTYDRSMRRFLQAQP